MVLLLEAPAEVEAATVRKHATPVRRVEGRDMVAMRIGWKIGEILGKSWE